MIKVKVIWQGSRVKIHSRGKSKKWLRFKINKFSKINFSQFSSKKVYNCFKYVLGEV